MLFSPFSYCCSSQLRTEPTHPLFAAHLPIPSEENVAPDVGPEESEKPCLEQDCGADRNLRWKHRVDWALWNREVRAHKTRY